MAVQAFRKWHENGQTYDFFRQGGFAPFRRISFEKEKDEAMEMRFIASFSH